MPVWIRKFTFLKMKEFYDKENKANQKAYEKNKRISKNIPKIKPTYTTRASNK